MTDTITKTNQTNNNNITRLNGMVKKGWGYELIFASNEKYCGKLLHFDRKGAKFSMHFHHIKDETWLVRSGSFKITIINTKDASRTEKILNSGDTWRNTPLMPHQLEALADNSEIIEVSTPDSVEDNYRVLPGDSQSHK